ncbi:MAG: Rpn family recombination-promoting nuclease/putative transposase, partial [Planctomycetaceae bacterium]|nr:Rpn family recombination-promoting nuclease/putative transposase [Planctomycetaceae bacterium]
MVVFFKLPVQIELAHPHDLLTRRFLIDQELMASMLEHYDNTGVVRLLDLHALRCESPITIDANLQEVIGDLRFSTKFRNGDYSKVFLFFEHQSKKIKLYSLHCLRKILEFYEECVANSKNFIIENSKFPYPLVVVLYHGDISWNELLQIKDLIAVPQGVNGNVLWFQIIVIDLSKIQHEKLQGHPALVALFDTLQSYSEGKLPENLGRIVGYFNEVKTDPRTIGWLTSIAHYTLAAAKISKDVIIHEFSKILDKKGAENM